MRLSDEMVDPVRGDMEQFVVKREVLFSCFPVFLAFYLVAASDRVTHWKIV